MVGRNLSPALRQELENLDKDPDSRKSAMKALRTYVKDLDANAIPAFLSHVSETKEPGSSGEYTISLYEVLARVHGRKIVPQIDNIVATVIRTLSSSPGSFPLHQACSKVVPAIARYGIDPLTPDGEKSRVIGALCRPLSDVLMDSQEGASSGAALCLKALVESDNWRFASHDTINDVCLKVAGALEEDSTETNAHMGLAMALLKHNSLIAEAYVRSLVRSGLRILNAEAKGSKSQKRFSVIQMINFLMKCVDTRCISTELAGVIGAMERCQSDRMPFVRGAAFEALLTAKSLGGSKAFIKREGSSSPVVGSNFDGEERNPMAGRDGGASQIDNFHSEFPSPESQTVGSFVRYDTFVDSPVSLGQSSCNFECGRRTNRRLWKNDLGGVDVSLSDGFLHRGSSGDLASKFYSEKLSNGDPSEALGDITDSFAGFTQSCSAVAKRKYSTPSPENSTSHVTLDNLKIYSTPRRLMRSLQDSDYGSVERGWDAMGAINGDLHSHLLNCGFKGSIDRCGEALNDSTDAERTGSASSSSAGLIRAPPPCACGFATPSAENGARDKRSRFLKVVVLLVLSCVLPFGLAMAWASMQAANEEMPYVVAT